MKETQNVTSWLQEVYDTKIAPFLESKGVKAVKLRILASFPSRNGESVEPAEDKEGRPNPKAGEAKIRFQYIPAANIEDGKLEPKRLEDPLFSEVSHGGRVATDVSTLLISLGKHNPWSGSIYGNGPEAEVAKRLETLAHGAIFAHVVTEAPGETLTKKGNVKVYGGHFERTAARVGLMGKGWSPDKGLTMLIAEWSKGAPKGASINLFPPESKEAGTISAVTLCAKDGTLVVVSARAVASEKGKAAGQAAALAVLMTKGPFTYVKDSLTEKRSKAAVTAVQAGEPQVAVAV